MGARTCGAVSALLAILGALSMTVAASAFAGASVRYATVHRLCPPPQPGRISCDALRLVPSSKGARGAYAYVPAAGAQSVGPAGGLTPADLASAYGYAPTGGGQGETVAVVEVGGDPYLEGDLATFDGHYSLPACTAANGCLTKVNAEGKSSPLPRNESFWWGETELDTEVVHSVCPNCKIIVAERTTLEEPEIGLGTTIAALQKLGAQVISMSFGYSDASVSAEEAAELDRPGTVLVAGAGDWGYYEWTEQLREPIAASEWAEFAGPAFPASSPYVVSVGGTSLTLLPSGRRASEQVWAGTGSGCSRKFAAPAWQQAVPNWASTGCGDKRLANDIAVVGNPLTGFDIYVSPEGGWMTAGGTSLSAPIVAGMYALAGGAHGVSYAAQTLYSHLGQPASVFERQRRRERLLRRQVARKMWRA